MIKAAARLKSLQFKQTSLTQSYGRVSFGPVHSGQGLTIGNTLRRILLNDLSGIGVIGAALPGVKSEFSTLPGVRESVVEIFLNLRELVFAHTDESAKSTKPFTLATLKTPLTIETFPYCLTAGDLDISDFHLVDPNQHIATFLSKSAAENFQLTLFLGQGRGYQSWKKLPGVPQVMNQRFFEALGPQDSSVTFPIDAVFMPIKQVNFSLQEDSVDGEYIYFEIWTNGSVHPFDAIKSAAKICMKFMASCLLDEGPRSVDHRKGPESVSQVNEKTIEVNTKFDEIFIEQLELSLRAYNCLKRAKILTLADLANQSFRELMKLRNFGQKSADEVRAALLTYGIELKEF
jgi:DNA-directed RNA polymerase subunit alpha